MSKTIKTIIGVAFISIVVIIVVLIFLHHLVTKSFPITKGRLNIPNLHSSVDIYRDEFGVPHISAHDEHDLMFAVGYVHAQDRLWQMDLERRAGEGRLSEILDTFTVKYDKLFRTLQLKKVADSLFHHLHPNSQRILEDYAEGVNTFIIENRGKYPIEFDMLNYQPEIWKPENCLLISKLVAWELSFAWWVDLTYAEIANLVSKEKFQEIFLSYPENQIQNISNDCKPLMLNIVHDYLQIVKDYREYFHKGAFTGGSNAWVISSTKSMSGKPILANDPHLLVSVPAQWYELHMTAPRWNVSGFTLPGIPLILIGQNDSLAWGLTNAMIDECDFFIEQEDSLKPGYYKFKNASYPIGNSEEIIYIGKSDSVVINVRSTHHGPIINDVHPIFKHTYTDTIHPEQPIALKWTGFDMYDEISGYYKMNRARNLIEFVEGLKHLNTPVQCVHYADVKGNIGRWIAGRVPVRGKHVGTLPLNGWTGEDEWVGYIPFDKLPAVLNPPDGIIISANQKFVDKSYPFYISTLWEPDSRYDRIKDLLSLEKISAEDCKQFQQDMVSYYSRDLTNQILDAFSMDSVHNTTITDALIYLRNWDYRTTSSDIASAIVNTFFIHLLHNTFEDELGNEVFNDFIYPIMIPLRITSQILQRDNALFFDDVRTDTIETKEMIIKKSFYGAIDELKRKYGSEMKKWQWGLMHQVVFEHPFGRRKPLDRVFNVGPFPLGGDEETINRGAFKLTEPYKLFAVTSMRQIVDMSSPTNAYRVLTLGQSGQPLHKYYKDQVSLWLNGGYRETTIDWNEIRNKKWEHLILEPR